MVMKNRKGTLKGLLIVIVVFIVFLSTYPFFQTAFDTAASAQSSSLLSNVIELIPFIVIVGLIGWAIKLGSGESTE